MRRVVSRRVVDVVACVKVCDGVGCANVGKGVTRCQLKEYVNVWKEYGGRWKKLCGALWSVVVRVVLCMVVCACGCEGSSSHSLFNNLLL